MRARARRLLLDQARRLAVRRLVRFACKSHHDLERALFHLDRFGYPDEDLRASMAVNGKAPTSRSLSRWKRVDTT